LCVITSIVLNVPAVLKALSDLRDLRALIDLKQTTILILLKKSLSLLSGRVRVDKL
jgi:hypothetical protein